MSCVLNSYLLTYLLSQLSSFYYPAIPLSYKYPCLTSLFSTNTAISETRRPWKSQP